MVFASTCKHASSAFIFESSSSDQIFLASSKHFKKYKYRWRALRKFSRRSLYSRKETFCAKLSRWYCSTNPSSLHCQLCLVGDDIKLRQVISPLALMLYTRWTLKAIQSFLMRHCEHITGRSLNLPDFQMLWHGKFWAILMSTAWQV